MEALLALDGAELDVERMETQGAFRASIRLPKNLGSSSSDPTHHYMFTRTKPTREQAIADTWQAYQEFTCTPRGAVAVQAAQVEAQERGQLRFRM